VAIRADNFALVDLGMDRRLRAPAGHGREASELYMSGQVVEIEGGGVGAVTAVDTSALNLDGLDIGA
jgi:hypothetical protein